MPDWRPLFAERNWTGIADDWPHLPHDEQAALLQALRDGVPKNIVSDGMESVERHVLPKDASDEWKGAAQILALGELEAAVEGEPPMAGPVWDQIRGEARSFLGALQPVSEGSKSHLSVELSREAHCRDALAHLDAIETSASWMLGEMDSEEDRDWLREVIAEIAANAFVAGRHMQEAWGKPFEPHAVRGLKILHAAAEGARLRKGHRSDGTQPTLDEMQRLIDAGNSMSRAAELAKSNGFGSSTEANRKLFQRHS